MKLGESHKWRRWGITVGLLAIVALSTPAFAQLSRVDQRAPVGGSVAAPGRSASIEGLSFELVPLSTSQLQTEAGKGIPGGIASTALPKSSSGTIRLWDEVPTMRVVPTQASETLTITLSR